MMLNCKEASRLLSERCERRLRAGERIRLEMHVFMCGACRAFGRQIRALSAVWRTHVSASKSAGRAGDGESSGLSAEMRERLRRALREAGNA